MRRLLLVANRSAYGFSPYRREVILRALGAEFLVEEAVTKGRGHAVELARGAVHSGVDLVVAWGGDGTLNEVANGLARTPVPLAVLPAGLANVFARSLGVPLDPAEATGLLLSRLGQAPRRIPLGRADGRYFLINCGVGLDAAIVRAAERRQLAKRAAGASHYVWTALWVLLASRWRQQARAELAWGPDLERRREGLTLVVFQNADPYTYLGDRPVRLCPDAALEGPLDAFGLDTLRPWTVMELALSALGRGRRLRRSRHTLLVHGEPRFRVRGTGPLPVQVDGEYVGERAELLVEWVPDALSVLA
ncbi:MAG TPA: diacylglycerol kinase family protein [Actinomycetota bacterium]|nr:diacylglycerol kinase family protein [Actinomycetota bacterium]